MKLRCTATVSIALLAASLLVAAMSGNAQATPGSEEGLIARGHAEWLTSDGIDVVSLTFNLVELPDGSVRGHGRVGVNGTGFGLFELNSFMFIDDSLAMAGEITLVSGDTPPFLAVGSTIFFYINDNDPDTDEIAQGNLPLDFGILTIQEIVDMFPFFFPPPPEALNPLIAGDIVIF